MSRILTTILTTIALLGGALLPVFMRVSGSHFFNDLRDAHAHGRFFRSSWEQNSVPIQPAG